MILTLSRGSLALCKALGLLLAVLAAFSAPVAAQAASLRQEPLEIVTAERTIRLTVEIADTEASRNQGMMFRKSIAPDRGMLFDFKSPRPAAFWMKNTFIPLDILFITADGHVLTIARNAVPHSQTPIPSGGQILGVLEIGGGQAAKLGIYPGDLIKHRIFKRG